MVGRESEGEQAVGGGGEGVRGGRSGGPGGGGRQTEGGLLPLQHLQGQRYILPFYSYYY